MPRMLRKMRFTRFGSWTVRKSHSSPQRCIHTGARQRSPAQTSSEPPSPRAIRTGERRDLFLTRKSSCRGKPIQTKSRSGEAARISAVTAYSSCLSKYPWCVPTTDREGKRAVSRSAAFFAMPAFPPRRYTRQPSFSESARSASPISIPAMRSFNRNPDRICVPIPSGRRRSAPIRSLNASEECFAFESISRFGVKTSKGASFSEENAFSSMKRHSFSPFL